MQFKLAAVFLSICSLAAAGCNPGQYVCAHNVNGVMRGMAQCTSDGSTLMSMGDCGPMQHCKPLGNTAACYAD